MITQLPPLSRVFFTRRTVKPSRVNVAFYLSWEDALWHLLSISNVPQGSAVLVPSFFCNDVVMNMESHGLTAHAYPVDENLQPDVEQFRSYLRSFNPQVVVIFHPVGITNRLMKDITQWIDYLPPQALLIEDSVHKVVDPARVVLTSERHYIIDSWRKVAPLQGAACYSRLSLPRLSYWPCLVTLPYRFSTFYHWIRMLWYIAVGQNGQATRAMNRGYDLIGDSLVPSPTLSIMVWLWKHLDREKIYSSKNRQVLIYRKYLRLDPSLYVVRFDESDFMELRGYPVVVKNQAVEAFSRFVREHNLNLRFELEGCTWTESRKIIYLPLGPHLSDDEIRNICRQISQFSLQR